MRSVRFPLALLALLAVASPLTACHGPPAVAPVYDARAGALIAESDLPLALTHYVFSRAGTTGRTDLARPLADRMLLRAQALFAAGRERSALAAVRFAAMLVRTNHVDPKTLSDGAVAALDAAVQGPAARGEEGTAQGIYRLWAEARPTDGKPKGHLDALTSWAASPQGAPSRLVDVGRDALRRSEGLPYLPSDAERGAADDALLAWMDQVVAFKDGERTPARYSDEVFYAVVGFHTAGTRLVAEHLRDGDLPGAIASLSAPQTQGFVSEALRHALLDAGSTPNAEGLGNLIGALGAEMRREGLEETVRDAIAGTALIGTGMYPADPGLAETAATDVLLAGAGDAAPAILSRALLGTKDDTRRPAARDVGRALMITASAMRDYADREDYDGARRTYGAVAPLLVAASEIGNVEPSGAMVTTLMATIEGESGRLDVAKKLYDEAIGVDPIPFALAGRARLDAREGALSDARKRVAKALDTPAIEHEPVLHADLLALAGDLARRDGDATAARTFYERSLKLLSALRASKGITEPELARRAARVLCRFADAEVHEGEAAAIGEGTANEPRAVSASVLHRFVRALRGPDPKRAKAAFHHAVDVEPPGEDLVRAALLDRAIARRAAVTVDPEVTRVLSAAAAHDDAAGRLARFALGTLDAATLLAKSADARQRLHAELAIALGHWADGGLVAAKSELEAIVRHGLLGAVDVDLALELLEPDRASLPGGGKLAF